MSAADSAAALPVAPPSRWSGLYSDALHSIFKFTSLSDLSRVLAVSHSWSDAVSTMPPMHATNEMGDTFNDDRLDPIHAVRSLQPTDFPALRSRLARHVSSFSDSRCLASVACLDAVSRHMPWMRELIIALERNSHVLSQEDPRQLDGALGRFTSLTRLDTSFGPQQDAWDASAFNSIIAAMGGLSTLESVSLRLPPHVFSLLSFAPLAALPSLDALSVKSAVPKPPSCSDSQIAEFRSMRSLKRLHVEATGDELLVRVLQPGHALQWTQLSATNWPGVSEQLAPLLGSLPSLITLHVVLSCPDVGFFSLLPQLTDVSLSSFFADPDELVRSLSHCTHIRRLQLHEVKLSGDHLATLLPCFPKLADLSLLYCNAVSSLRCCDTTALAASLTQLSLEDLARCPSSEVAHLLNLRCLHALSIAGLAAPVSADLRAQFVLPSARFPCLQGPIVHIQ